MNTLRHAVLVALAAGSLALGAQAAQVSYTLDPGHTDVVATWSHMGYSHPSAMFNDISGTLTYDPDHPEKATLSVSVPIASVHTASPKLDEHLQHEDFFDVAKYPVATFKSTRVERGSAPDKLLVTGDLTMHGITHPATLDVTVGKVGAHPMTKAQAAGFSATATINRSDWGVKLYVPMVSDEIKLAITTEAAEAKPAPAM